MRVVIIATTLQYGHWRYLLGKCNLDPKVFNLYFFAGVGVVAFEPQASEGAPVDRPVLRIFTSVDRLWEDIGRVAGIEEERDGVPLASSGAGPHSVLGSLHSAVAPHLKHISRIDRQSPRNWIHRHPLSVARVLFGTRVTFRPDRQGLLQGIRN